MTSTRFWGGFREAHVICFLQPCQRVHASTRRILLQQPLVVVWHIGSFLYPDAGPTLGPQVVVGTIFRTVKRDEICSSSCCLGLVLDLQQPTLGRRPRRSPVHPLRA
jgi:hypothetical protein